MKSPIKIRKAAPIPPKGARSSSSTYPFEAMRINESFIAGPYSEELVNKVNRAAQYHGERLGKKFCLRKVDNNLTVWREQ